MYSNYHYTLETVTHDSKSSGLRHGLVTSAVCTLGVLCSLLDCRRVPEKSAGAFRSALAGVRRASVHQLARRGVLFQRPQHRLPLGGGLRAAEYKDSVGSSSAWQDE